MEKRRYHRYTAKEDALIKSYIRRNPQNLSKAFVAISKKLNTSPQSVKDRWYAIAKNQKNKVYLLTSSGKNYSNYKIKRKGMSSKIEQSSKTKWQRILDILFE